MLVIKKEQIESFIAEDDTQLLRVISEIIRESFFESIENYDDETIRSMVKTGIDRAKSYGFERAEDIASFVAVMFEISPQFDTHEQIKLVLKEDSIPYDQKFEYMFGRIPEEIWAEAEKTYDAKVWFPENPQTEE
jgi:hypothetical protein